MIILIILNTYFNENLITNQCRIIRYSLFTLGHLRKPHRPRALILLSAGSRSIMSCLYSLLHIVTTLYKLGSQLLW